MTVTEETEEGAQRFPAPAHDTWPGLLRAEWTKIRSVRSTVWSLLAFMVVSIGFSVIVASVISANWSRPGSQDSIAQLHQNPSGVLYGPGFFLGQLALCVLGVIVMSSEYTTGAIRSSLLAVPRRVPMLVAKVIVFAVLEVIVSAVTVFAVFFISTAILHDHMVINLSDPGMLRATIGGILYLGVLGLLALAIGGLIRHTAGAIATIVGLVLVVPPLVSLIPGSIAAHITAYLPSQAGILIAQTSRQPGDLLSGWQGFGVLCLETVVLLVVAGVLLVRRDA